ncbi:MAG: 2-oxoglutarate dehydrogenase E1 component, partial [Verrucomicrobiota bacterium]
MKYHLGYDSVRQVDDQEVAIFLSANPSHLEAVNPVVEGKARARQRIIGDDTDRKQVMPILIHGDAAFAGQGPVAEVLNLSQLPGYRTGGTLHIIVNNQIGFTTLPEDARSSDYCTDVAKMIEAPVFHVNGDHPLEVMFATQLALEFRQTFSRDVIIDMVCYRRHGHNEGDEPEFTQPKITRKIKNQLSSAAIHRRRLIKSKVIQEKEADGIRQQFLDRLDEEAAELDKIAARGDGNTLMDSTAVVQLPYGHDPVPTGISLADLKKIGLKLSEIPSDFKVNDKIKRRFLDRRQKAIENGGPINWALAESLAFGSLLLEGTSVRLSGQDSRRGTFSHRHSVLYDVETRERHIPLCNLSPDQAKFCAYNSLLSETAVLGFDYGYSLAAPEMLILWEAQFGDFANGAQVIIDQFISSAESKWQRPSSIVLLLPHGYEGMGPEHSSARIERFLQLCAEQNMQVCNLTTPAQYFHALRRQIRRPFRKPLILMAPKSLLGHPACVSTATDFEEGQNFREMLDDPDLPKEASKINRLVFCSGKVYYDLIAHRSANDIKDTAIIRVEQVYPFHEEMAKEIVARYTG